jgi:hypothetical protein
MIGSLNNPTSSLSSIRQTLLPVPQLQDLRMFKECPAPAAEASGRMLDKLEVGLLREPIIGFGTEPSQ